MMMYNIKEKKISIVIPIYNGEKYLSECLESVISQTYSNVEIVCVDDGSTDETGRILEKYSEKDSRILIITQRNLGVVLARKNGALKSNGDYIMFVDSDDIISNTMVEELIHDIGNADFITSGVNLQTSLGGVIDLKDSLPEGRYDTEAKMDYFYDNFIRFEGKDQEGILQYCIGKLYRRNILLSIVEELNCNLHYAEDRELIYRYALKSKSVVISYKKYYFYRYRKDSTVHSVNPCIMEEIGRLYNTLKTLFESHAKSEVLLNQLEQMITSRVYLISTFMGFKPENQTIRYIMPYFENIIGKRLVLYGAGVVGCNYYRQTIGSTDINWILWVDKCVKNKKVCEVAALESAVFDYVIVAVKSKELFEEIKRELMEINVNEKQILWKNPISLAE